jgi:hypothetical protein
MRIVVAIFFLREKMAERLQDFYHRRIRLENVLADQRLHIVLGVRRQKFRRQAATIIHGREHRQSMLLPQLIVILPMAGSDVDETRTRFRRDEISRENLARATVVEKRMRVGEADEIGAFERSY